MTQLRTTPEDLSSIPETHRVEKRIDYCKLHSDLDMSTYAHARTRIHTHTHTYAHVHTHTIFFVKRVFKKKRLRAHT